MLLACQSDGGAREMAEQEGPFQLDLENRSVTMPLGPGFTDPASARFVEVEIAEVQNPKKIRLTFEVHHQSDGGDPVLLGTFSLYPPDNPGRFIVPARGRLRSGDDIVLSMLVLDKSGPEDTVRITVRRISLRQD